MLLGIFIYVFSIIFMQLTRVSVLKSKYFKGFADSMLSLLLEAVLPDLSGFMREVISDGGDESWITATVMMVFILLGSVTVMNMLVGVLVEVIKTVSEIEREQCLWLCLWLFCSPNALPRMEVTFVKKIFSDMITKMNLDLNGDDKISKEELIMRKRDVRSFPAGVRPLAVKA